MKQMELPKESEAKGFWIKHGCLKKAPPLVFVQEGIDPAYAVGYCGHCREKVIVKK